MLQDHLPNLLASDHGSKFILPTVKIIEVLSGLLLAFNIVSQVALILLLPVVFGLTCLQLLFNSTRGYAITFFTIITYVGLVYCEVVSPLIH